MRLAKNIFVAIVLVAMLASVASAATLSKTSWTPLGAVASGSGLVTDPTGTLYSFAGTTVKTWDPVSQAWSSPLTTHGSANGFSMDRIYYADGCFIMAGGNSPAVVSRYNISTSTWDQASAPGGMSTGQGAVYNSKTDKFWVYGTYSGAYTVAVYDPTTGTFPSGSFVTPNTSTWNDTLGQFNWCGSESVNIGNTNYAIDRYYSGMLGNTAYLCQFDLTDPNFGTNSYNANAHTATHLLGTDVYGDRYMDNQWTGSAYVKAGGGNGQNPDTFQCKQLAVNGTDIYFVGDAMGTSSGSPTRSSPVLVYHTAAEMYNGTHVDAGSWKELVDLPDSYDQGSRDFFCEISKNVLYVRDGVDLWAIQVAPEPATMALLAVGGVMALLRRRK